MKKKLILIFGLILILTGCGDNQAHIKNKVLNEFKKNNIYSYFNSEGLKMIQEAGFKQYRQIVLINRTDITLKLNFETKKYTISASGKELLDYVLGKNISVCREEDGYAVCEANIDLEGNSIVIPSSGDEVIDQLFNQYPIMINNMSIDENYINSLSNPIATETRSNPLGGKENAMELYKVYCEQLPNNDTNKEYLESLKMKKINTFSAAYTDFKDKGETFMVHYGPQDNDYDYSMQRNAVTIILGNGEKI